MRQRCRGKYNYAWETCRQPEKGNSLSRNRAEAAGGSRGHDNRCCHSRKGRTAEERVL